tara:strand:+ start:783 stop:1064 length:282 start_codon:yes stop_codon:yes gene_type:complete
MITEKQWLVKLKRAVERTHCLYHQRYLICGRTYKQDNVMGMIADRIIELAEQDEMNQGLMGKLLKDYEETISCKGEALKYMGANPSSRKVVIT